MLLVTTALEETWGKDEEIIFLGEWCRVYGRRNVWGDRDHSVTKFHWDDRLKLATDEAALKLLKEKLLVVLAMQLNKLHSIDKSIEYWRVVLSPWLVSYVAVIWDRWENIRITLDKNSNLNTYALSGEFMPNPPKDYSSYIEMILTDRWNHYLFLDIIGKLGDGRVSIIRNTCDSPFDRDNKEIIFPKYLNGLKWLLIKLIDRLSVVFSRRNSFLFINPYFPVKKQLELLVRLGDVPTLNISLFNDAAAETHKADLPWRKKLSLGLSSDNDFEDFIASRIFLDMPSAYLEDFFRIRRKALSLKIQPKVIATANAHWSNELFKVWIAEQRGSNKKLVIMEHGGAIPPKFDSMDFEDAIADIRTSWCRPFLNKHVQLPSNKLLGSLVASQDKAKFCTLIGFENPRYLYRATAGQLAGQYLVGFEKNCALYELLNSEVKLNFKIKPYQEMGWSLSSRYRDRLNKNVIHENPNLKIVIRESKLLICTYPNTTFSEAMYSGRPTLLYYPMQLWETKSEFDELLFALREANILFEDPHKIASHINQIWFDPDKWWISERVQKAKDLFFNCCLKRSGNPMYEWINFFKSIKH
jgi:putative transferase (TIGR04331 family)